MTKKILVSAPKFYGIDEAIREAFENMGFKAVLKNYRTKTTINETIARRIGIKFPSLKPLLNPVLKYYLDKDNKEFINIVKKEKPNLLFIIKGDFIFPETLQKIKKEISCPVVVYIWDDPFCSFAGLFSDDYRKSNLEKGMHLYDFIFVYDTYYVEQIKTLGITNVEYLPLATDPNRYRKIEITNEDKKLFGYDICFVGVPYPNRVEVIESLQHYNLGIFGDGWTKYFLEKGKKAPPYYRGKAIGEEVIKIYLASKVALNIHDPEAQEGLNTRTFDILACGAAELVDYKKNLEIHFNIGEEIATFKNNKELLAIVDYYCENNNLLKEISDKGRQRVLKEHTWSHRINKVIDTLKEQKIFNVNYN
jgi:spore maturation protein CgeB